MKCRINNKIIRKILSPYDNFPLFIYISASFLYFFKWCLFHGLYPLLINNVLLTCFQFYWDLDFATQNLTLIPFDQNKTTNCNLCNFKPNNTRPNSSPRDVVITLSYGTITNCALFLRTLRTTQTKASCVFIMQREAYINLPDNLKELIINCSCQVIPYDFPNIPNFNYKKDYVFHLIEIFLMSNPGTIDRVGIFDLSDFLFQKDPFHEFFPKNQIHLVDEGFPYNTHVNVARVANQLWVKVFDPKFKFSGEVANYRYWCAGYIGGTRSLLIDILHLLTQHFNYYLFGKTQTSFDQGCFNYLNLSGKLQKAVIPVAPANKDELIRHSARFTLFNKDNEPPNIFPYIKTMYNENLTAVAIHQYYNSDDKFRISVLKTCPRPNKEYTNYLAHCDDKCITSLEQQIQQESET